jgi:hypothetical protein
VNATYNDLLAVWDAYNGTGTGVSTVAYVSAVNGTPPGWKDNSYWSATSSATFHALVELFTGGVVLNNDVGNSFVALQVL